jgi:acyl phosphate:glycerol-3-phosphate acyltransferase
VAILSYTITALAAYLLGSIPTGYLVGLAKGVDIRSVGSGNIGATNAFRILGKPAGVIVGIIDALKGFLACWLVPKLVSQFLFPAAQKNTASREYEYLLLLAGLAAIVGHNYTCWLRFKGGKGIATTAGVFAALMPLAALSVLSLWIVVVLVTRYVSLGSIIAAIALPVAAWIFNGSLLMVTVAGIMGALALYRHRTNIRRLLNGTENRFGVKSASSPPAT